MAYLAIGLSLAALALNGVAFYYMRLARRLRRMNQD